MTLDELKKYRLYCSELNEIDKKLKSSKTEESTVGLLYRKKELRDKTESIIRFVNSISEYKVRRAIKIYCIDSLDENNKIPDWEDVACKIGNGCTEGAIKMAVKRYLEKNI